MTLTPRQATILLLESRHNWHPTLTSQFARFGAVEGELATKPQVCTKCNGAGDVNSREGRVPCETCGAQGQYLVDAYTGFRTAQDGAGTLRKAALSHHDLRRKRDAEIGRLREQTRPPLTELELLAECPPFPWERERERHHRHGDYQPLTRALEHLAGVSPTAHQIVTWTYEYRIIKSPAPPIVLAALASVDVLANRILTDGEVLARATREKREPEIRVPAWLLPKHPAAARVDKRRAAA